jgi:hypothetical protein
VAHASRTGLFALGEGVQHMTRVEAEIARRDLGDYRQGLTLVGRVDAQRDRTAIK